MNEPPASAQGEPNLAGGQPISGADTPPPRPGSRKLRLAFAALAFLLVALAGLLLFPAGRAGSTVQFGPLLVGTNEFGTVMVSFMATNTGRRPVIWTYLIPCRAPLPDTWPEPAGGQDYVPLHPGRSRLLTVAFNETPRHWCAELIFQEAPPRLSHWSYRLRTALAKRLSVTPPDARKYFSRFDTTNRISDLSP